MNAEFIFVGTEILLGNILNTNAQFLSEQCAALGISCYYQTVVGDNKDRITKTFLQAWDRSDIVIFSGGLGPTEDDLTKETVAEALDLPMVMDKKAMDSIREFFARRGLEMPPINEKQAYVPQGSKVLYNANGTAPGIICEKDGKMAILLPGPGNELMPMFENDVRPYLSSKSDTVIVSKMVKMCGIGESAVDARIRDLTEESSNPTVAPYAKTGEVHVRVTAKAPTEKEASKLIKPVVRELKNRFGPYIYTTEEDVTLEKACVDLLISNHLTVSTVESCTGGLVAGRLINVPGVSEVLKLCYVTYSNKAKRKMLGIKKAILEKHTAVSRQVCEDMLKGAAFINKADVVLAVTGLAGPDGGTEEIPVGTVFIGCSVKGKITVEKYNFSGNRSKIRENAVAYSLVLLRRCVLEYFSEVTFGSEGQ